METMVKRRMIKRKSVAEAAAIGEEEAAEEEAVAGLRSAVWKCLLMTRMTNTRLCLLKQHLISKAPIITALSLMSETRRRLQTSGQFSTVVYSILTMTSITIIQHSSGRICKSRTKDGVL